MTADEWEEKRVAYLEVGDEVRDWYGTVIDVTINLRNHSMRVRFSDSTEVVWPSHGRVDVRRPVEVRVKQWSGGYAVGIFPGINGNHHAANFVAASHAEEYAERLRASADERRKALGR